MVYQVIHVGGNGDCGRIQKYSNNSSMADAVLTLCHILVLLCRDRIKFSCLCCRVEKGGIVWLSEFCTGLSLKNLGVYTHAQCLCTVALQPVALFVQYINWREKRRLIAKPGPVANLSLLKETLNLWIKQFIWTLPYFKLQSYNLFTAGINYMTLWVPIHHSHHFHKCTKRRLGKKVQRPALITRWWVLWKCHHFHTFKSTCWEGQDMKKG